MEGGGLTDKYGENQHWNAGAWGSITKENFAAVGTLKLSTNANRKSAAEAATAGAAGKVGPGIFRCIFREAIDLIALPGWGIATFAATEKKKISEHNTPPKIKRILRRWAVFGIVIIPFQCTARRTDPTRT
jgi:hypothetical protein